MSMIYGMLVSKGRSMSEEWGADFGRGLLEILKKLRAEFDGKIAALEAEIKAVREAGVNFKGPFVDGETYVAGDAVQRSGSLWRAYATTTKQPPGDGWRLMVKKGRDARDRNGKDAA
jgi:hypothetical protein